MWDVGDRLTHRFNPELGPGIVIDVRGRTVVVEFPQTGDRLSLAAGSDALAPLRYTAGQRVMIQETGQAQTVEEVLEDETCRLSSGDVVTYREIWPIDAGETLFDRLARGDVDKLADFSNRLDALHLARIREADGLGSFLGGRIELFPHQLYAAERATRANPVRWLLADEVGLGKTVEACLILNRLVHTGRVQRVLVVAPETLTVQWLGELWRKYHHVFVLVDDKRLQDISREHGADFNPFEAHERMVISLEMLATNAKLAERAAAAGFDLLIVDEAHHLRRPPGHPGNPEYRAIANIVRPRQHLLLLTATPLEEDSHGFFRLLQLLRPEEFPEDLDFAERLAAREPLPACTSATRRVDLGGLPPRVGAPVEIPEAEGWQALQHLENELLASSTKNVLEQKRRAEKVLRANCSGIALDAVLDPADTQSRAQARRWNELDPRVDWLAEQGKTFRDAGEKTLVFVAHRATLEHLRTELSRRGQVRTGVFHEDLSAAQRDIEVAQFRLESGPSMLISTECGGEGRNFQFCTRLVLFDLPWNPNTLEQRIGRLDRIGRRIPVEIVYFKPPGGFGRRVAELYESIGIFREPLGGLAQELARVGEAVESAAGSGQLPAEDTFADVVQQARSAQDRVHAAAYHELHRDPYRPELAEAILARVPEDLEEVTEEVVTVACERLRFRIERVRGETGWSVELGSAALIESLPGVPAGSSFIGTFDRETALEREMDDFFASGHPLVEGVIGEIEDGSRGRVALLHVDGRGETGFGILAIYRHDDGFEPVFVDLKGKLRPDLAERVLERPLRSKRVSSDEWTKQKGWPGIVRGLAERLDRPQLPVAVAAVRFT